ncbi:helix-turn-helix transcriptional regulator [Vibrio amylolyticus]|uniref:helix-turn-helix domain-containing protein n=1 Tax=Vibrio amylolyticus TaxID=2847292 RepID=UPI0035540BA1
MNTYPHILSKQVTKLAESPPDQFYDTLTLLAQDVLRAYDLDRLSLFPYSSVLLSQGDFFSTSLDGYHDFSHRKYEVDDYKKYTQILEHVDNYLSFTHFDLLQSDYKPLVKLREEGIKSHGIIPLCASGQTWGAITVGSFSRSNLNWESASTVSELKAIGSLWLCFLQQFSAMQAHNQNGGTFLIKEKEKLLSLSKKQREVLTLLGKGLTAQECAEKMFISRRTVESHKYRILKTLGVKTHTELVQLTNRHDISAQPPSS